MNEVARQSARVLSLAEEALSNADWVKAGELFGAAVEQHSTPEALEGLARAQAWLEEPASAQQARLDAYQLYRDRGDIRGAARVALALAEDALIFHAEEAVFAGWTERARRLLDGAELSPEHALLAVRDAFFALLLAGDTATARARAADAVELAHQFDVIDLQMLAVAIDGAALVAEGNIADGMRRLDEATAAATGGEMRDLELIGQACCFMIDGCERARDFDRADQWCRRVEEFCKRFNLPYLLAVCRTQYATVLTARGDWPGAEAELQDALDRLAQRPGQAVDAMIRLAELRRRQGRAAEAAELLDAAVGVPDAEAGRAALALDNGDAIGAVDCAERFLRNLAIGDRLKRAAGLELLVRAAAALGDRSLANQTLAELESLAAAIDSALVRAGTSAAAGAAAAAFGEADRARPLLQDAVDLYERARLPYEAAEARITLAEALAAQGRTEHAMQEADRAATGFSTVGADHLAERARSRAAWFATAPATADADPLSPREREVLCLVADGMSNKEIAARLVLSEHTVHRHVANILDKLQLSSRTAAASYAARQGLTG